MALAVGVTIGLGTIVGVTVGVFVGAEVGVLVGVAVGVCNVGEIALRTDRSGRALEFLGPAAHTLRHLGSVFAEHAEKCLREAAGALNIPPEPPQGAWREALMAAAERALAD